MKKQEAMRRAPSEQCDYVSEGKQISLFIILLLTPEIHYADVVE
ncbi:MAG: hypothetical protein U0K54_07500 [Acutalibacteraceae bacterium]|nr:hypothetical protein [Acutalibacteraceae bacterium]